LLHELGVLSEQQMQALAFYVKTPLKNHRKLEIGFIKGCV